MKRYHEVDFMKGLAVIIMVVFHYFYLGTNMGKLFINTQHGIYYLMSKFAHLTFIFMVGVNLVITRLNYKEKSLEEYKKGQYKRVAFIAFLAAIISIVSYLTFPDKWIRFGILHFIAAGILLLLPFIDKPDISLGISLGVSVVYILNQMGFLNFIYPLFHELPAFILGLFNLRYNALDHFAIIKYLPVMALGIFAGHQIYKSGGRKIEKLNVLDKVLTKDNVIVNIGKRSLEIYITHFILLYLYFDNI